MRGHYVYIVRCSDGSLYTGYTTDLSRRLKEHNDGRGSKYTQGRRPVVLSYAEVVEGKGTALKRENSIKRMSRSAKLLLCTRYSQQARQSRG